MLIFIFMVASCVFPGYPSVHTDRLPMKLNDKIEEMMDNPFDNYKKVISVSLPLVLSMAATTVMEFTDRVFLAKYSIDAIAAAMPAGIAAFLVLTLFTGIASYLNVFIAQYTGAGYQDRIGSCLWQGIYFAFSSMVLLLGISFFSKSIFALGGHTPEVQRLEGIYFRILCLGGGFNVLGTALACFFSGRGHTRPVMLINIVAMIVNIPLDYILINGHMGFPEMGIKGAGTATVFSWFLIVLFYSILIFNRRNEKIYQVLSCRKFDKKQFIRIVSKGSAAGIQFTLDVLAFTFFIFMVGRLGTLELAVSNIVFSIQSITFMPAIGFSIGLSTLVGQSLGRNDVRGALGYTGQTIVILLCYTIFLDLIFIFFPEKILSFFISDESVSASSTQILSMGNVIIRIMAIFICFDAMYFTFLGVLRGAGDNKFIMWNIGLATVFVMIMPLSFIVFYFKWGLLACWLNLTIYVITLFSISLFRYKQGKWKKIRVI